jgi:hypothetical protein
LLALADSARVSTAVILPGLFGLFGLVGDVRPDEPGLVAVGEHAAAEALLLLLVLLLCVL